MTAPLQKLPPELSLGDRPTAGEVAELTTFLKDRGTFRFPTLSSGLFSAAAAENPEFRLTGYQYVWTRDNCHIAHALWLTGQKKMAVQAAEALLDFYGKHSHKFLDVIEGRTDPAEPMNRPHIRFDGESLSEVDVRWAHAQNDALGYTLWLVCKLLRAGDLSPTRDRLELFKLFVQYFQKIEYWRDEDSGHWEETRKIEASSIGPVVAGLTELRAFLADDPSEPVDLVLINDLIEQGRRALLEILPCECIQPDPTQNRRYDAALLFLIFPLNVVDDALATQILADVTGHLSGPIGIRRYIGDSYWCANYRDLLSPEVRTTDFSDDMSARDSLLKPGEEAQWCIFDPIVSVIYGQRYLLTHDAADLGKQVHHLRRALHQLTTAESRFPAYRLPESYFLEHGKWIPNDICPLLWTQANMLLALDAMQKSAVV
ncbi:glycoside hydrolase family 15 protein [Planctomicrobium piriforme]|uniref:Phosphorylase kinase alpha/beta subunit n=1 Tax=Planctomicrobium piriforme TaxID=1576369 RepID=A0A1I3TL47_9PLAN|nr:glycoside hydrolase family 15 protein [Planctomicrobium piriforme]SFJ70247.1 phosphorylase kinase alpha/beta subunit [Planctomicrobium piriforme]